MGFTLIEIIVVLVLLSLLAVAGSVALETVVRSYTLAKSSDEVAQKAQMALNRMTIEFSYIKPTDTETKSNLATSFTYLAHLPSGDETLTVALSGNQINYTAKDGAPHILTDDVAANGLAFLFYDTYDDTTPAASFSTSTRMIAVTLTMQGKNWPAGVTKAFTTRVFCNKLN